MNPTDFDTRPQSSLRNLLMSKSSETNLPASDDTKLDEAIARFGDGAGDTVNDAAGRLGVERQVDSAGVNTDEMDVDEEDGGVAIEGRQDRW